MTTAPPRPAPTRTAAPAARPRPLPRVLLWAGAAGLAAVLVLALVVGGARPSSGLASAGPFVDWGRPVASLASRIAALGTMGALLFAGALLPRPDAAPWQRAMRAASGWALAWAAATLATAWLTLSELVGVGPLSLPVSAAGTFVSDLPAGRAALTTLTAALSIALAAAFRPGVDSARFLLLVAGMGLVVPAVLTGHSASAANHMLAVNNLAVHVVTAAVWVGGLVALVAFGRGTGVLGPAAARFSAVALWCFVLMGVSGVLASWLVLGGDGGTLLAALGTGYGVLLLGKTAGLLALGGFGWWHRRRTLPGLRAGSAGAFRRFAVVEAAVMLATVALAVGLAASPPPAAVAPDVPRAAAPADPGRAEPAADPMAGHDHGDLSVAVLVDATRFHVAGPVEAGSRVTVFNSGSAEVTLTADDGSFDVVVPAGALMTFAAPAEPGDHAFGSRHSGSFQDVLVVE
jgi:putative copper export protein